MRVAHIILAHKNPRQLSRLVEKLKYSYCDCWIHVDRKSDHNQFAFLSGHTNVFFIQPTLRVDWGCFNTVEAMLFALRQTSTAEQQYDYFNFISGQDYPIRPAEDFVDFLKSYSGSQFMNNGPYEDSPQSVHRFKQYHFNDVQVPGIQYFQKLSNKLLPPRRFSYPHEIRKGSQWMAISREAVLFILDFLKRNSNYPQYFRRVHIPDEFFFQTILHNSPLRQTIDHPNLHYVDWTENKAHPKLLTSDDFDRIISSDKFFARKFDIAKDASVLDAIDEHLSKKPAHEVVAR
jgi:Core-2/I-Branching enzyme